MNTLRKVLYLTLTIYYYSSLGMGKVAIFRPGRKKLKDFDSGPQQQGINFRNLYSALYRMPRQMWSNSYTEGSIEPQSWIRIFRQRDASNLSTDMCSLEALNF